MRARVEVQGCGRARKKQIYSRMKSGRGRRTNDRRKVVRGTEIYAGRVHLCTLTLALTTYSCGHPKGECHKACFVRPVPLSKSSVHDFHQLIVQFTRSLSDGPLYNLWDVFPRNIVIPQLGRQAERINKTAVFVAGQFPKFCEIGLRSPCDLGRKCDDVTVNRSRAWLSGRTQPATQGLFVLRSRKLRLYGHHWGECDTLCPKS